MKINKCITGIVHFILWLTLASSVFASSLPLDESGVAVTYKVTPVAGANGKISPTTPQTVTSGSSVKFTATPSTNYVVNQWLLDGKAIQTGGETYTLSNVQANHTVQVTFSLQQFSVTPSAGANGTISPVTVQKVNKGGSLKFSATPATSYVVNQWLLDGMAVQTGGTSYTLNNITANHTVQVTFKFQGQQYTITPSAGANGTISPSKAQTVNAGSSILFTATPSSKYVVNQWLLDSKVVQTGGVTYNLSNIKANHTVEVTFAQNQNQTVYVGAANGKVYYSTNQGTTWTATTNPSTSNAVNSVFATSTTLYAASADHHVYFSTNNGTSWSSTSASPDASAVKCVFVTSTNTIYIGTEGGHVYSSINNGSTWTATTNQPVAGKSVNALYVTSSNALYAGSANGNVYYSTNGTTWTAINGSPDGSAIHNVYVANTTLYVNTANEYAYTSTHLTGSGTWTAFAQTVFSLFVNSNAGLIYSGTQSGYVFSLITGNELGFVAYSPINSVFVPG